MEINIWASNNRIEMKIKIRQQSFSRPLLMMLAACFSKVQLLGCNYEILQSSSLTKKNSEAAAASRIFCVCAEKNRVERGGGGELSQKAGDGCC